MPPRNWFPEVLTGERIVLRRHAPENVAAFRRWYADPEIARLARYQQTPMRPEEIDRFFEARVVGPNTSPSENPTSGAAATGRRRPD